MDSKAGYATMKCLCFITLLIGCSLAETDTDTGPDNGAALYNIPVRGSGLRVLGQSPVAPVSVSSTPNADVNGKSYNISDGRVFLTKRLLLLKKFFAGGTPKIITIDKPVPIPIPIPQPAPAMMITNNDEGATGSTGNSGTNAGTATGTGTAANTGSNTGGGGTGTAVGSTTGTVGEQDTDGRFKSGQHVYRNIYERDDYDDEELEEERSEDDGSDNDVDTIQDEEDDEDDLEDVDDDEDELIIRRTPLGRNTAQRDMIARQNRPLRPIRRHGRPNNFNGNRINFNRRKLPPLPELDDYYPENQQQIQKQKRRRQQIQAAQNAQRVQAAQAQAAAEQEEESDGGVIQGISHALGLGQLASGIIGGNQPAANQAAGNNGNGNKGGGNRPLANRPVGNRQGQFVQGGQGGQGGFGQGGFGQGGQGGRPQGQRNPQRRRRQPSRRRYVGTNNGNLQFKNGNKKPRRKFQLAIGENGQPLDSLRPLD